MRVLRIPVEFDFEFVRSVARALRAMCNTELVGIVIPTKTHAITIVLVGKTEGRFSGGVLVFRSRNTIGFADLVVHAVVFVIFGDADISSSTSGSAFGLSSRIVSRLRSERQRLSQCRGGNYKTQNEQNAQKLLIGRLLSLV